MTTLSMFEPNVHVNLHPDIAPFATTNGGLMESDLLDRAGVEGPDCESALRIAAEVERRWRQSPYGGLATLRCEVRERAIRIRGQVSCFYLKQLAQETLRDLVGTSRVENLAEVRPQCEEVGSA